LIVASVNQINFDGLLDLLAEKVAARLQQKATSVAVSALPKLLSVDDAAARMGCTTKSLRHIISSGSFPKHSIRRFGRKILIEREDFDRWLSAH
jgi:excisionase family DNA binding protein